MSNEYVEAVVCGLNPQKGDIIGSICGVGHVPFALLEFADKVIAFDNDLRVLDHASGNIEKILDGNYSEFIEGINYNFNKDYFSASGRLDKIKQKLKSNSLILIKQDVFHDFSDTFSKIYLSNALSYFAFYDNFGVSQRLNSIKKCLLNQGFLYISDSDKLSIPELGGRGIPQDLMINENLTSNARRIEKHWYPLVFQKGIQDNSEKVRLKKMFFSVNLPWAIG